MGPPDSGTEQLLASTLLGWRSIAGGWQDELGGRVEQFHPLETLDDAKRIVSRMEELGFSYEARELNPVDGGEGVIVSFFAGSEVYTALAEDERRAICTAATRFLMSEAGAREGIGRAPEAGKERRHALEVAEEK